jgi:hypothetical protein
MLDKTTYIKMQICRLEQELKEKKQELEAEIEREKLPQ